MNKGNLIDLTDIDHLSLAKRHALEVANTASGYIDHSGTDHDKEAQLLLSEALELLALADRLILLLDQGHNHLGSWTKH